METTKKIVTVPEFKVTVNASPSLTEGRGEEGGGNIELSGKMKAA